MLNSGLKLRIDALLFFAGGLLLTYQSQALYAAAPAQPAVSHARATTVTWLSSLKSARKLSLQTGKPVLVDFSATWCGPCQAMIHDTFPSPAVQPLLVNLICVRVDIDQDQQDAQEFGVNAIPRILLLSGTGATVSKMDITGYEDPDSFVDNLRAALDLPPVAGSNSVTPAAASSPAESVAQALASNAYGKLKAQNKAVATQGLKDLIAQLGEPASDQVFPLAPDVLARAGSDAYAALVVGMSSAYLSQRVGAYSMYRRIHGAKGAIPTYDPWAKSTTRTQQLAHLAASIGKQK